MPQTTLKSDQKDRWYRHRHSSTHVQNSPHASNYTEVRSKRQVVQTLSFVNTHSKLPTRLKLHWSPIKKTSGTDTVIRPHTFKTPHTPQTTLKSYQEKPSLGTNTTMKVRTATFTRMPGESYRRRQRSLLLCPLLFVWRLSSAANSLSSSLRLHERSRPHSVSDYNQLVSRCFQLSQQ